jgi:hypothetical protein
MGIAGDFQPSSPFPFEDSMLDLATFAGGPVISQMTEAALQSVGARLMK